MARYLMTWEMDTSRVPVNPKERAVAWGSLLDMVESDMKKGVLKDWGAYTGEMRGYGVSEGSELEINSMCHQYIPFVQFTVHPLTSVAEMRKLILAAPK